MHDDMSVSMIGLYFCKQKPLMHYVMEIIASCQETLCYSIRRNSVPLTLCEYFLYVAMGSLCFFSEITLDSV